MLSGDTVRLDSRNPYASHLPVDDGRAIAIWVLVVALTLLLAVAITGLVLRYKDRKRRGYPFK